MSVCVCVGRGFKGVNTQAGVSVFLHALLHLVRVCIPTSSTQPRMRTARTHTHTHTITHSQTHIESHTLSCACWLCLILSFSRTHFLSRILIPLLQFFPLSFLSSPPSHARLRALSLFVLLSLIYAFAGMSHVCSKWHVHMCTHILHPAIRYMTGYNT